MVKELQWEYKKTVCWIEENYKNGTKRHIITDKWKNAILILHTTIIFQRPFLSTFTAAEIKENNFAYQSNFLVFSEATL